METQDMQPEDLEALVDALVQADATHDEAGFREAESDLMEAVDKHAPARTTNPKNLNRCTG